MLAFAWIRVVASFEPSGKPSRRTCGPLRTNEVEDHPDFLTNLTGVSAVQRDIDDGRQRKDINPS